MSIKFDDGANIAKEGFDNKSASKRGGKNKIMFFRAPNEQDEAGNKRPAGELFYILRLMKYQAEGSNRKQAFIRKFEHEAWKTNAEGKKEFAGRITCLKSDYMIRELGLTGKTQQKARELCPMCKYAEAKFLAAKNGGDRTLYRQSFEAEAKEYVYGVAYVLQDPNYKTNNGTLRVFRLNIPRVKKDNRRDPLAYGICEELQKNMEARGISVMKSNDEAKNLYDIFCEVIAKEIEKGKAGGYSVFNGGNGVNLGIRVKHVDLPDSCNYFGNRDMITDIRFSSKQTEINEINPSVSAESLEKLVNDLDFDGNFMHVDTVDDIRDFCSEHYDLSSEASSAFEDEFEEGFESAPAKVSKPVETEETEKIPPIRPTSAAKPAPAKVEATSSFDDIMDEVDGTDNVAQEEASTATTSSSDDDDMPF